MTPETFRGAGPVDVLSAILPRLGARVNPSLLASRFELHDDPASLLALVAVAREWGFSARAFQGELANLKDVPLPAVVHLRSAIGGDDSFGVLVAVGADSYELESADAAGTTRLTEDAFAAAWTGVVVTFARSAEPTAPPQEPGALARWRRLARADRQAGALAAARVLAAIGVAGLALASAMRLSAGPGVVLASAALVVVDALIAATCVVLFHASRRTRVPSATPRLAQRICGRGGLGDCEGVLSSKWARIGGFDLPVIGVAFAASSLVLAAVTVLAPPGVALAGFAWIAAAHLLAAPASLFFIGLQVWPLRRFCPLCMTVHAGILAGALLVVPLGVERWIGQAPSTLAIFAIVHGVAFLTIAGLVVPHLDLSLEASASRTRLGWIAATPWGALAEAAGRARAFSNPPPSAFQIGAGGSFRIDALVHPFCSGCGPVVDGLVAMTQRRAGALEVGFHLAPRDPKDPGDLALCAGISAIGLIAGGEQTVHVFRAIKAEPRKYLEIARDGGAARVVSCFLSPSIEITGVLPAAIEAVERAAGLAELLRAGTPTLLLNGRVWESTLDDLDAMIERYPQIVASVLR